MYVKNGSSTDLLRIRSLRLEMGFVKYKREAYKALSHTIFHVFLIRNIHFLLEDRKDTILWWTYFERDIYVLFETAADVYVAHRPHVNACIIEDQHVCPQSARANLALDSKLGYRRCGVHFINSVLVVDK